ncbi:hypothetical protein CSA37_05110 [Candidatus Fermentibacteria bacterium]|nr:MAG: hypothetical protein CSA37_05110 [Candidatus Fermentibacteria bacterium]
MGLLNIHALLVNSQPVSAQSVINSLIFSFFTTAFFLLIQFFGARFYTRCHERYSGFPLVFFIVLAALSALALVSTFLIPGVNYKLIAGVAGGVFLWTSLGEISETMGWYSPGARSAVWLFLLSTAAWLALAFIIPGIPVPILGFLSYPLLTWGILLTRVRVIKKWGAESIAAVVLLLVTAAVSGGSIVAGVLIGTRFAAIMSGLVFAVTSWSIMEIIWERGMARGPWKAKTEDK